MNSASIAGYLKKFPLAALAVVVLLAGLATHFFRSTTLALAQEERDRLDREVTMIDRNKLQSVDLEADLEKARAFSQIIDERLVVRNERALNQDFFYRLAREASVDVQECRQVAPVATEDAEKKRRGPPQQYSRVNFRVKVAGEFQEVLRFLHNLENGYHFTRIEQFTAEQEEDAGPSAVALALNIDILGRNED